MGFNGRLHVSVSLANCGFEMRSVCECLGWCGGVLGMGGGGLYFGGLEGCSR